MGYNPKNGAAEGSSSSPDTNPNPEENGVAKPKRRRNRRRRRNRGNVQSADYRRGFKAGEENADSQLWVTGIESTEKWALTSLSVLKEVALAQVSVVQTLAGKISEEQAHESLGDILNFLGDCQERELEHSAKITESILDKMEAGVKAVAPVVMHKLQERQNDLSDLNEKLQTTVDSLSQELDRFQDKCKAQDKIISKLKKQRREDLSAMDAISAELEDWKAEMEVAEKDHG